MTMLTLAVDHEEVERLRKRFMKLDKVFFSLIVTTRLTGGRTAAAL
jgi:hypothetical protein